MRVELISSSHIGWFPGPRSAGGESYRLRGSTPAWVRGNSCPKMIAGLDRLVAVDQGVPRVRVLRQASGRPGLDALRQGRSWCH